MATHFIKACQMDGNKFGALQQLCSAYQDGHLEAINKAWMEIDPVLASILPYSPYLTLVLLIKFQFKPKPNPNLRFGVIRFGFGIGPNLNIRFMFRFGAKSAKPEPNWTVASLCTTP